MASHGGDVLFAPIIGEMIPFFKGSSCCRKSHLGGESIPQRRQSIVNQLDRLGRALLDASPALDTVLGVIGMRLILFDPVHLTRANLHTVLASTASFMINPGDHMINRPALSRRLTPGRVCFRFDRW
jgi:hypothetical protein